jgi:transcription antitermination factor NusG
VDNEDVKVQRIKPRARSQVKRKLVERRKFTHDIDFTGVCFWHILRAPPAKEVDACFYLDMIGCRLFTPWRSPWKKPTVGGKKSRMRLRRAAVGAPAFPGYIFVGVTAYGLNWLRMRDTGYFRGVVALHGEPYRITNRKIDEIMRKQKATGFRLEPNRETPKMDPGDAGKVVSGGFGGHEFEAVDVTETAVKFWLHILGKEQLVEIPLDMVRRIEPYSPSTATARSP